jgi:hypothetical protein
MHAAAAAELGRLGHTQRATLRDVGLLNGRAYFGCSMLQHFSIKQVASPCKQRQLVVWGVVQAGL